MSEASDRPRVLYAMPYGPPVYEIVAAECPPELSVEFLERGGDDELLARLPDYEFVIALPFRAHHFEAAKKVRFIQAPGVGYDGLDVTEARARGIPVATTPEGTVEGVAEHVLLLILAVNKQLLAADRALREGRWLVWQLRPTSFMPAGQTLGLVGLGRIGREVARRAGVSTSPWSTTNRSARRRRSRPNWACGICRSTSCSGPPMS